jgi:alpha-tubulin suppressor-like RCC1 family protein/PKD repeat protein
MSEKPSISHADAGMQSNGRRIRATLTAWPLALALLLASSCDRAPTSPALAPQGPNGLLVPVAGAFSTASLGWSHGCGLRNDGVVECWGDNGEGQAPATKAAVSGAITDVAAGLYFTCAATSGGVVECWGQPGSSWSLVARSAASGTFTRVGAGFHHACAVRSDGAAECWGANEYGSSPSVVTPTVSTFVDVTSGDYHNCALRADGAAQCWGDNFYGQAPANRSATAGTYTQLSARGDHTCGVRTDGMIECWGKNSSGESPATITAQVGTFVQVAAGQYHTCALRSDGISECWGSNGGGQAPVTKTASAGAFASLVSGNASCAVRTDGTMECWGAGSQAPPSRSTTTGSFSSVEGGIWSLCAVRSEGWVECWGGGDPPQRRVAGVGKFVNVGIGWYHLCAVRNDGVAECWGSEGSPQSPATKAPITGSFTQVSPGFHQTCALRSDGAVECWGSGEYGNAPALKMPATGTFTSVSSGDYHSCALRSDGVAECWGDNFYGQAPATKTAAAGAFSQVSVRGDHSCGVRTDGVVECWGKNASGQAPATRAPATGTFVQVAAGHDHTCALRSDGVGECWGDNGAKQAPGTMTAAVGSFTKVMAGLGLSCGLRTDGVVVCVGDQQALANAAPPHMHVAPTAVFTAPASVTAGDPAVLSFSGAQVPGYPQATVFTYAFDCGDGAGFGAASPTATKSCASGSGSSLTVRGLVYDQDNYGVEYGATVTVNPVVTANRPPVAQAGGPYTGNEGALIAFDGTGSLDPDGDALVTYAWDFGDGTTGSSASPSKRYANNGTYTVKLVVTDARGLSATSSTSATISNVAPTGTFAIPSGALENAKALLSFSGVTDPGTADVLQYAFDCGDGKGYGALTTTSNRPCVAPDNGVYAVKGRVQDADGGITEYTASLTVANVTPTATLILPSKSVPEGSSFTFAVTKPVDAPADLPSLSYFLFCGVGSPPTAPTSSSVACPTSDNGALNVSARVLDKDGGYTTYTGIVSVANVAPTVTILSTQVGYLQRFGVRPVFQVSDPAGTIDMPNHCPPQSCVNFRVTINWGDGGPIEEGFVDTNPVDSWFHFYRRTGNFTITMQTQDKDGGVGSASVKVSVK